MRQTQGNVLVESLEGLINGKQNRGQRRNRVTDDIRMRYKEMKRLSQNKKACTVRPAFVQKTHHDDDDDTTNTKKHS